MKRAKKLLALMLAAMMVSSTIDYSGLMVVNAEENDAGLETAVTTEAVEETGTDATATEGEAVQDSESVSEAGNVVDTENESIPAIEAVAETEVTSDIETATETGLVADTESATATETVIKTETLTLSPEILAGLPDNDSLYEAYVRSQLYGNGIDTYGMAAGNHLSFTEQQLYYRLRQYIYYIAVNEGGTTYFRLDEFAGYYSWPGDSEKEAYENMRKGVENVVNALLLDCPYQMYWYDKNAGYEIREYYKYNYAYSLLEIGFPVAAAYRSATGSQWTVDSGKAAGASNAVTKAQEIVDKYEDETPYNRMKGYIDEICKLVSYDENAGNTYGDMAQILNVFDGDLSTNVDSKGYARAFQYLCDMDIEITCYTATGNLKWQNISGDKTGNGTHTWNVVTLDDGSYIVDVTNCDEKRIGAPDKLFMVGGTGSAGKGYSVEIADGSDTYALLYTYDDTTANAYSQSELTLTENNYEPVIPSIISQPQDVTVKAGEHTTFTVSAAGMGVKYQWQVDRNDSNGFVDIKGANSASYTTGVVKEDCNNFKYICLVSNSNGYVATAEAVLTVANSVTDEAEGSGSWLDPYIVNTSDELRAYLPIGFVRLGSDIVVSGDDYISLVLENDSDFYTGLDLNGHILDFSGLGDSEKKDCKRGISVDGTGKHKLSFCVNDSNPDAVHDASYVRDDGTPITGGIITGYECYTGGYTTESSIYIDDAEFAMTGGTFFKNKTDGGGSCIGIRGNSQVSISDTDFYNNEGGYFGGCIYYINYSAPGSTKTLKITNCNFMNNYSRITSTIFSEADTTLIDNCLIKDNVSEDNGTVQIDAGTATIKDTVITDNESLEEVFFVSNGLAWTAGVYIYSSSSAKIILDGKVIIRDNIISGEERNMNCPKPVELGSNFSSDSDIGVLYSSQIGEITDKAVVNNIGSFSDCFTSDVGDAELYITGGNLNVKRLQHNHTADTKHEAEAATCAAGGTIEYYVCATCGRRVNTKGELLYRIKSSPTGKHTAGDWIVDKEATATSEGARHTECTVCGKVLETEVIPKLDSGDSKPDTGKNDTDKPDTGKTDTDKPDTGKTDTDKPDTGKTDTDKPDTGKTDTDKPDTGKTDTDKPDTGKTDTDKPDTGKPDTDKPDTDSPATAGKLEKKNTDKLALNNDIASLSKSLLTTEESQLIEQGADAVIYASLVTDVSEADMTKAELMMDSLKLGKAYDITLWLQVGDNTARQITTTDEKISLSLKVEDELINKDSSIERTYKVIRVHDGAADVLDGSFDETSQMFTFETDRFSTYVLVYSDRVKAVTTTPETPAATGTDTVTAGTTAAAVAAAAPGPVTDVKSQLKKAPKTGDTNPSVWMFAIIIIAGAGLAGYGVRRRTGK